MRALALATALVGLIVIAAGVFAALIDRHTKSDAMRRLHHMANNDALTGLPNRTGFQDELARSRSRPRAQDGGQVALCAIDLNRFKEINDVHGHKAGDEVLVRLARADARGDRARTTWSRDSAATSSSRSPVSPTAPQLSGLRRPAHAALQAPVDFAHFTRGSARASASPSIRGDAEDARDAGQQCRPRHVPGQGQERAGALLLRFGARRGDPRAARTGQRPARSRSSATSSKCTISCRPRW